MAPLFPTLSHEQDAGYPRQVLLDGATVTAKLGNGDTRTRPETSDGFRGWRGRIDHLTAADFAALDTFHRVTVAGSVKPFRWTDTRTGLTRRVRFAPTEPPRWRRVEDHQDLWSVEFTLMEVP